MWPPARAEFTYGYVLISCKFIRNCCWNLATFAMAASSGLAAAALYAAPCHAASLPA